MGGENLSYPILYSADETDFFGNGLGTLPDALSVLVTEERNGEFTLSMTYPQEGKRADLLTNNRIIKVNAGHKLKDQRFVIKTVTPKMSDDGYIDLTVYAEHISYITADLAVTPSIVLSGNAESALQQWKGALIGGNPDIVVDSDIETKNETSLDITKATNARQALGGVEGSILDTWGGEYRFDNLHISLRKQRGTTANTLLSYGRNLLTFEQEQDISQTYTSIYPYAAVSYASGSDHQMVTVDGYIVDSEYLKKYPNRKILPVDFGSEFSDYRIGSKPSDASSDDKTIYTSETEIKKLLKNKAQSYVVNNRIGIPKVSTKISFADLSKTEEYKDIAPLEHVDLCDIVPVRFEKLGIDSEIKVTRVVWNVLLDAYDSIELGDLSTTLGESISAVASETKEVKNNLAQTHILAQTAADGNHTVFRTDGGTTEPTAKKIGDLWFKTDGNDVYMLTWNGTNWEEITNTKDVDRVSQEVASLTANVPTKSELSETFRQSESLVNSKFDSIKQSASLATSEANAHADSAIASQSTKFDKVWGSLSAKNSEFWSSLEKADSLTFDGLKTTQVDLEQIKREVDSQSKATSETISQAISGMVSTSAQADKLSRSLSLATSEINSAWQSNRTSLSNLAKGLDSLSTGVKSTTDSLTATYNDQNGKVATLTTDVNGLKGAVKDNEDNINSLSLGAKGMSALITNAQGSINTLQADADGLKQEVTKKVDNTTYQTGISNLNGKIDLKANKSYVDGELSKKANSAELSVTNEQVKAQASRISSVTTTVNGVSSVANNALSKAGTAQSTANTANNKIDNLSVGGRNLLIGTSQDTWIKSVPSSSFVEGYSKITSTNINEITYTLSFKAKATKNGLAIATYFYHGGQGGKNTVIKAVPSVGDAHIAPKDGSGNYDGHVPFSLSTQWKTYWVTYTVVPQEFKMCVIVGRLFSSSSYVGETVNIKEVQLEKGNKPTDWSPAPEDVDNKITDLQNKITPQQLIKTVTDTSQASHLVTADSVNQSISGVRTEITKAKDELTGKLTTVETKVQQNTNETKSTKDKTERLISSLGADSNGNFSWANNQKIDTALGSYQTIKKIDGKIDNLSVGGRNLLTGTADFSFNFGYNNVDSSSSGVSDDGEGNKQVKFYKYNGSSTGIYFRNDVKVGQEYTLSFDARVYSTATGDETYIRYGYEGFKINTDYLTTNWKRYNVTFTVDKARAFIIYSNTKHTVYVRKIQLEKGNKATDWSPSPKDVDGKINGVQNNLTSYKAEVSNTYAKASTVYTKSDVDGIAKSVKEQTADSIKTEISKVSIGGTNLIKNSLVPLSENNTWVAEGVNVQTLDDYVRIRGLNSYHRIYQLLPSEYMDKYYSISFDASNDGNDESFDVQVGTWNNLQTIHVSGGFQRYKVENVLLSGTPILSFVAPLNKVVRLKKIQLEKGNKATDWSPSPEDVAYKSQVLQKPNGWSAVLSDNYGRILSGLALDGSDVRFKGNHIHLDGQTIIDNSIIKSAMIDSIDATKIKAGSIDGQRLRGTVIDGNVANIKNLHATNLFADGLIDGKFLHITGASQLDSAIIKNAQIADGAVTNAKIGNLSVDTAKIKDGAITSAKIGSIDAGKITAGTLNAANVKVINLDVSNLVGDKTNFVKSAWKDAYGNLLNISGNSIDLQSASQSGRGSFIYKFNSRGVEFNYWDKDKVRKIGSLGYAYNSSDPTLNGLGVFLDTAQNLGNDYGADEFSINYSTSNQGTYNPGMVYNATGYKKDKGFHWYQKHILHSRAKEIVVDGARDPLILADVQFNSSSQNGYYQPTLTLGYLNDDGTFKKGEDGKDVRGSAGISFLWNSTYLYGQTQINELRVNGATNTISFMWTSWSDWKNEKYPSIVNGNNGNHGGIAFPPNGNTVVWSGLNNGRQNVWK